MNFKILSRVFKTEKSLKNILYLVLHSLLMIVLISYVVYNILSPGVYYRDKMGGYLYSNFDVRLYNCTEQTYKRVADSENIESILSTTYTIGGAKITKGNKEVSSNLMPIYSNSLDILNDIVITSTLFVKKDDKLLKKQDAIVIALETSVLLDADIGDKVDLGVYGEYTVAGIFENSVAWNVTPLISSMVLYNNAIADVFNKSSELMSMENMRGLIYIRFKDKELGRKHVNENYIFDIQLFKMYGEDYLNKADEKEIERFRGGGDWRDELLEQADLTMSSSFTYNAKTLVLITGFGIMCMCILLIHESSKKINQNMKQIAILSTCGLSKKNIFIYFAFTLFIKQVIIQSIVIYLYKNVLMLKIANGTYVANDLILRFIPLFLLAIIFSALASGFFAVKKVGSKSLLQSLNYREVNVNE